MKGRAQQSATHYSSRIRSEIPIKLMLGMVRQSVGIYCAPPKVDNHYWEGHTRTDNWNYAQIRLFTFHPRHSMQITFQSVGWDLPHGHSLQARCSDLGMYKLLGESRVLCSNGLWAPRMPSCVPTTLLTNYSGAPIRQLAIQILPNTATFRSWIVFNESADDSPPSIRIKVGVGSGSFEPSGVLAVLPSSILHLDCIYPRRRGTPEWTWTGWFRQYITGWSAVPEEKGTRYRLTIKDIQIGDSGTYTCATPRGLTNSIVIVVAVSICQNIVDPPPPLLLRLEGNKLGQRALYRCPLGYTLEGTANATCLASGECCKLSSLKKLELSVLAMRINNFFSSTIKAIGPHRRLVAIPYNVHRCIWRSLILAWWSLTVLRGVEPFSNVHGAID